MTKNKKCNPFPLLPLRNSFSFSSKVWTMTIDRFRFFEVLSFDLPENNLSSRWHFFNGEQYYSQTIPPPHKERTIDGAAVYNLYIIRNWQQKIFYKDVAFNLKNLYNTYSIFLNNILQRYFIYGWYCPGRISFLNLAYF